MSTTTLHPRERPVGPIALGAFALTSLVWCYWSVLLSFYQRWNTDPQYSHGWMVPLMAVGLVWLRGIPEQDRVLRPDWRGLPLMMAGLAMRHWAAACYFEWIEWVSLVPVAAGVCLTVAGVRVFRHTWTSIAFLVFMIPLPYRIEVLILPPLQNLATEIATFTLQTLGLVARAEGNVVWIGDTAVGIAQACSGLRMLTGFVALSVAVSLAAETEWWKKMLIIASAIPVALICNAARVTVTGFVYSSTSDEAIRNSVHDWLGLAMPALGLALLWGERCFLDALIVEESE